MASRSSISDTSSAAFARRSAKPEKRGSSAHSGRSRPSHSRTQSPCFGQAITMLPSMAAKVWNGTIEACAVPERGGVKPRLACQVPT